VVRVWRRGEDPFPGNATLRLMSMGRTEPNPNDDLVTWHSKDTLCPDLEPGELGEQ